MLHLHFIVQKILQTYNPVTKNQQLVLSIATIHTLMTDLKDLTSFFLFFPAVHIPRQSLK